MNWKELTTEITAEGSTGNSDAPVSGIEYDSRRVGPGSVFVAMKGGSTDGNKYIDKAIAAGALGIITDSATTFDHLPVYQAGMPALEVEHGRRALAQASAAFFGHPERKLAATGITGTNGKTTTAFLTEVAAQRRRPQHRPGRHHRISRRRRSPSLGSHHARIARPVRVDGRRRSPRRHRTGH